eukprot:CCRYP_004032-RA/>CCRYP_004032-RA protein AED:0.39 eAED:0.39 QI:212/1/1/1/0/0/2/0/68
MPSATTMPATNHVAYPMVVLPKTLYHPARTGAGMGELDFWRRELAVAGNRRRPMRRETFRVKTIIVEK